MGEGKGWSYLLKQLTLLLLIYLLRSEFSKGFSIVSRKKTTIQQSTLTCFMLEKFQVCLQVVFLEVINLIRDLSAQVLG